MDTTIFSKRLKMIGLLKRLRDGVSACLCRKRKRIDVIAWVPEYYLTETITAEIAKAKPDSIVMVGSTSHKRYEYTHLPPDIRFRRDPFPNVLRGLNARLPYLLYPVEFILEAPVLFLFYLWMGLRFRVHTVFFPDARHVVVVALLRKLRLFSRLVFYQGDWLPGSGFRRGIWSRFNREVYFPIMDRIACKLSDLTVNQTDLIAKARTQYWGRQIPGEEILFVPRLTVDCKNVPARLHGHKILFQGVPNPDSGLDIVLKALPIVRERLGSMTGEITLKIVGPFNSTLKDLTKVAGECGLDRFLEYAGYVDRAAFDDVFADCYCGVNLITDPNSYSIKAVPGKVMYYIQYLLPPLVTPYNGPFVDTIREHKLGLVVNPEIGAAASALVELYEKRSFYVQNLQTFLTNQSPTNIMQILCPETPKELEVQ